MSKKIQKANIIIVVISIILLLIIAAITLYEYKKSNQTLKLNDENQIINKII